MSKGAWAVGVHAERVQRKGTRKNERGLGLAVHAILFLWEMGSYSMLQRTDMFRAAVKTDQLSHREGKQEGGEWCSQRAVLRTH